MTPFQILWCLLLLNLQICSQSSKYNRTSQPCPLFRPELTACLYFTRLDFSFVVGIPFVISSTEWGNSFPSSVVRSLIGIALYKLPICQNTCFSKIPYRHPRRPFQLCNHLLLLKAVWLHHLSTHTNQWPFLGSIAFCFYNLQRFMAFCSYNSQIFSHSIFYFF